METKSETETHGER